MFIVQMKLQQQTWNAAREQITAQNKDLTSDLQQVKESSLHHEKKLKEKIGSCSPRIMRSNYNYSPDESVLSGRHCWYYIV